MQSVTLLLERCGANLGESLYLEECEACRGAADRGVELRVSRLIFRENMTLTRRMAPRLVLVFGNS